MASDLSSTDLCAEMTVHQPADRSLAAFEDAAEALEIKFEKQMALAPELNRSLVSFQANKSRSVYRWYKFKEAFSAELTEYLLERYRIRNGKLLDPFAGSGTALFAASAMGIAATGIELLPIGQKIIDVKKHIGRDIPSNTIIRLAAWLKDKPWKNFPTRLPVPELRITVGAYGPVTKIAIERYLAALAQEAKQARSLLTFALLCVLENVSFTRKDGQYLRWDHRSNRRQGTRPFNKGPIPSFDEAISCKLKEIIDDIEQPASDLFADTNSRAPGTIHLEYGSCLNILPTMPPNTYDAIVTSPPYCNRYDYTRTYALELALLGVDEKALINFRQTMLSCTVENRAKDLLAINPDWGSAMQIADAQECLQSILRYLEHCRTVKLLNNNGIPRMVRGYFYEMTCVIHECARVLKKGAYMVMVNDNVRYAGASIPVDLILSDIAEALGFKTETILVLPQKKGNSSQQMGSHGRAPLRKCVYVWRKT